MSVAEGRRDCGSGWHAERPRLAGIVLLTVANMVTIVFPVWVIARHALDDQPDPGWGYGWIILGPPVLLGCGVVVVDILLLGQYFWKRKSTTLGRVGLAALGLIVAGAIWGYSDHSAETRAGTRGARHVSLLIKPGWLTTTSNSSRRHGSSEICQLNGFYYTQQTDAATGNGGESPRQASC